MNSKSKSDLIKNGLAIIGSIFLGSTFIYSAYTKLFPVELFELTFVDLGIANWTIAPIEARLFIGIEFFIGFLLLLNLNLSKKVYKAVLLFLLVFIVYLIVQIFLYGNKGNCGCFGTAIKMTPWEGILKNLFLMAVTSALLFLYKNTYIRFQKYVVGALLISALSLPFILNPVELDVSSRFAEEETGYKLELDLLYSDSDNPKPGVELRKGKWVVAFLSLSCEHCRIAASKMQIMKKNNPQIPIYFILNGKEDLLQSFFDETKSEHIPHIRFRGENFLKMSGPQLPAIYLLENGVVYKKPNYFTLDQSSIEDWLQEK